MQGLPGAGKSRVIHWLRHFFEEVLGWQHGVEYVILASQNTMAALVGGRTFHSWANIAIDKTARGNRQRQAWAKPDLNPMFDRVRAVRWLITDEGSTLSAEVCDILNATTQRATRKAGTYLMRPDGSKRQFGGMSVEFFVDWW